MKPIILNPTSTKRLSPIQTKPRLTRNKPTRTQQLQPKKPLAH